MSESSETLVAEIGPGSAIRVDLKEGDELIVSSPRGGQGGDLYFLGFDQALTRDINGFIKHGRPWQVFSVDPGLKLYDGNGEPVLEVGKYRSDAPNDIMYPGCRSEIYDDGRSGCREIISAALGIDRTELTGMFNFFVNAKANDEVYMGLLHRDVKPGDYVSLVALRDTAAAVSACPDDQIPGWKPDGVLRVTIRLASPD